MQTLLQNQVHTRTTQTSTTRPVLFLWLSQAICLSPLSLLMVAVCPGRLWASHNSPSVIQQHINLLKSQPFQKGSCQSNFGAVVQGQRHTTPSDGRFYHFRPKMTWEAREGPACFSFLLASFSFTPLILSLWELSQKAILRLCPSRHICMSTLAFNRAQWVAPQPSLAQRSGWSSID